MQTMWVEGRPELRWRTRPATAGAASSAAVLEVPNGCALPRHVDSAEETVVVVSGAAEVEVDGEVARLGAGEVTVIAPDVAHQVRNAGDGLLHFVAVYASADAVTTYEAVVQPAGDRSAAVA